MERNWKRIGAWCGIVAGIQFVIITIALMIPYPEGYSFLENSFSSLGLSVTRGVPTPLNWFFFATATTLAGVLSIPFWVTIRTVFTDTMPQKALGSIGTIIGVVAGPCLAGVGIFAGDVFPFQHGWSTLLFFTLFAIAIGFYSVVIILNKEYGYPYALFGFLACTILFLHIFVISGAAMQKLTVYTIILYSVIQGYKLLKLFPQTTD
ncbi:MAG: hypothetical protein EAX95_01965 [Candidatus Thorarchaeota archaeon]|nr:hypothetical protein [Candidatus Thorarchaeota archaeon]